MSSYTSQIRPQVGHNAVGAGAAGPGVDRPGGEEPMPRDIPLPGMGGQSWEERVKPPMSIPQRGVPGGEGMDHTPLRFALLHARAPQQTRPLSPLNIPLSTARLMPSNDQISSAQNIQHHMQDEGQFKTTYSNPSQTPPLQERKTVDLPPLSPNGPIQVNTYISYHSPFYPSIHIQWDMSLPPTTARVAYSNHDPASRNWPRDVAVRSRAGRSDTSSLTIRIQSIARPVVVFPGADGVIRNMDVLSAVYDALLFEVLEGPRSQGGCGYDMFGLKGDDEYRATLAADTIRFHFGGKIWWTGLRESLEEKDVWFLEIRVAANQS